MSKLKKLVQKYKSFLLPVRIAEFVYAGDFVKSFAIYLYLQLFAGSEVSENDEIFKRLCQDLKMNDPKGRTFGKHFKVLLDLKWIKHNQKLGIYQIRSFHHIRNHNFEGEWATTLILKDIKHLQTYLVGVILCNDIRNQKCYCKRGKGKSGTEAKYRAAANQSGSFRSFYRPLYYGKSNDSISHLLGCSYTRACQLKLAAAEAGYIKNIPHFKVIRRWENGFYQSRAEIKDRDPELAKRLKFRKRAINGRLVTELVQQLPNEIVPLMQFKRISRFSELRIPFGKRKTNDLPI